MIRKIKHSQLVSKVEKRLELYFLKVYKHNLGNLKILSLNNINNIRFVCCDVLG